LADEKKDLQDLLTLRTENNKKLQEELKLKLELKKLRGEEVTATDRVLGAREAQLKAYQDEAKILAESKATRDKELKTIQKSIEAVREKDELGKEEQDRRIAAIEEENKLRLTAAGLTEEEIAQALKGNVILQERINKLNEAAGYMKLNADRFAGMLGIGDEFNKTVLGGMIKGIESTFTHLTKGTESFSEKLKMTGNMIFGPEGAFSMSKITGMIMNQTKTLFTAMDKARATFFDGTAAGDAFGETVTDVSREMVNLGLGMNKAGEAVKELYNGLTVFKDANAETRRELGIFVATLHEMGISSSTSVKSLEFMTKSLGMSTEEAKDATEQMVHFAKSIQMSASAIMDEFSKAMPVLAAYGKEAEKVFKGLAKISRETGIEVSSLLSVTTQFDTFDQAAQSVGRLNGILGGAYLNSIEMVYASEDERAQLLRESLELSGKSWESMSKFERQTLANASGFRDLNEAAKFYNTNLDDPAVQERIEQEEKLADMAKKTKTIMDNINNTMQQFAISMEPLINFIRVLVGAFSDLNSMMGGSLGFMILVFAMTMKLVRAKRLKAQAAMQEAAADQQAATMQALLTQMETLNVALTPQSVASDSAEIASSKAKTAATTTEALSEATAGATKQAGFMGPLFAFALPMILGLAIPLVLGALTGAFANGTPPGGAPGGLALVNEAGPEGIKSGAMSGIIPGGPQIMNLKKGDHIIPNKNLGGPSAKDIGSEVARAVQGALSVQVDVSAPDGKKLFDAVQKQENRNFRRTMANRTS